MPQENQALLCPRCRVPMNRHAEKPEYTEEPDAITDPALGVAVVEVHTCRECGESRSRRAPAPENGAGE